MNDQLSLNFIDQDAFTAVFGDGNATTAQVAAISDPDTLVDLDGYWYDHNHQASFNTIDQDAFTAVFGNGNATSAQVASINDGDTLVG